MPPIIHPPNLPLRPYLDDIWDVLTGFDGTIGSIEDDINDIEADITNILLTCCADSGGDHNIDGGHPGSVYLPTQVVDGGGP